MASLVDRKHDGVFELLSELCARTASQYADRSKIPQKQLSAKMRSHSYGIILGKTTQKIPYSKVEPVADLWSYYFTCRQNVKNIAEHKRAVDLKNVISKLIKTDFNDEQESVTNILKFLLILKNSVKPEFSQEIFKNPFTFGVLDEMLPKLPRESFGSPEPYHYYPSHVFELPYTLKSQGNMLEKQKSMEYTVESYDSSTFVLGFSSTQMSSETKRFVSPMSIPSITSVDFSPYSETNIFNFPRLTSQRDLQIPKSSSSDANVKIMLPDSKEPSIPEVTYTDNIWAVASRVNRDIPEDIWEVVSKMPLVQQRRLIATSSREVGLWRREYSGRLCELEIVPERQLIRHVMYLNIGVETTSFPFSHDFNCFYIKENLALEGISVGHLKGYVRDLLLSGTYYKRLYQFAFNHSVEDHFRSKGLVYEIDPTDVIQQKIKPPGIMQILADKTVPHDEELVKAEKEKVSKYHDLSHEMTAMGNADSMLNFPIIVSSKGLIVKSLDQHLKRHDTLKAAREIVRRYLLGFRLAATEIYEECMGRQTGCLPTLLQILHHMEPLKYEIETVASIYKMIHHDSKTTIPHGAELMSYLFNEISLVTHTNTASTMFSALFSVCRVYFRFIERFIFEGELDDWYNEFFIKKDAQYANSRSKRYWDKGFHITQSVAVPEFLRVLAKLILLCGKSLRLLKLCNPNDPLVLLISSDHPSIKCCATFDALERQQQLLDVYRTRCLFVSGEPVTFDQILLKNEAEKKAFTEMASMKQAETLEKIVAERKRLAQLIVAEKQHSLRVLEGAMAETREAKTRARQRERNRFRAERALERAADDVDAKIRDDERNKIMEYYSKLNIEVEKSKIHTEWKIRRLQLDQSRMQLLSTEERNLKREKLELEHQQNEKKSDREKRENKVITIDKSTSDISFSEQEIKVINPTESISVDKITVNEYPSNVIDDDTVPAADKIPTPMTESTSSIVMTDLTQPTQNIDLDNNKAKSKSSSDVFSAICNAAKNIFSLRTSDDKECDNKKPLDAQGNVVTDDFKSKTSSDVIGGHLDGVHDNEEFLKAREEAVKNKQKVMKHEFGQTDKENNRLKELHLQNSLDEANNIDTPFAQAKRNKLKVLGAEFDINASKYDKQVVPEPRTDAQKQALLNKQKVLGVKYNLPVEVIKRNEPANKAQEEAAQNRDKMLGSDFDAPSLSSRREKGERAGLTLNLKPYSEISMATYTIPTPSNALTPGEFPRLDLETPTTADIPLGAITSDVFTPRSENGNLESARIKTDKEYLGRDGFDFSILVDEAAESETHDMTMEITDISVKTDQIKHQSEVDNFKPKRNIFNLLEGTYNLDDFDPFGTKDFKRYSKDYFSNKMSLDASDSCYTHPALILEETKKKPYTNIFASNFVEEQERITCDNIATLTACLQRSVMLPLTYQLEVVNNAILTHFLVNLDMYQHLRSLKNFFFLMDGEFSNSICRNLFAKLTKTLNPQELLNFSTLHNILDKALGSSITHVHKFSENLSFTITESPLSFQHTSPDVLQCLSLTYAVSWPLNILLSQDALLRYARVFQYLIKMRRIFWTLGEDFQALKLAVKVSKQQSRKLLRSPQYISVQIYRHIMSSFIRALDNYIVTTCILTSWKEFENDLKKARTLDDLYECHVVYIKKVLFRCLLNNRSTPVMKLLNDIFTVILKFSRVLKSGKWHQKEPEGHFSHTSFAQLDELFHLFEKLTKYLHKVVTKLMECGYQRHLAELLTMVNMNQYYDPDKSKEEHNSSVVSTA